MACLTRVSRGCSTASEIGGSLGKRAQAVWLSLFNGDWCPVVVVMVVLVVATVAATVAAMPSIDISRR